MDLKTLLDTPPWDWPRDAGRMFWRILVDPGANESDRLVAAELAGDFTVINDDLADVLLTVAGSSGRARATARAVGHFSWAGPGTGGDGWIRGSGGCTHYGAHVS